MLNAIMNNTEEQIMNTELIISIVQQTALVMVTVVLLYGLQKVIEDHSNDQVGAIEKARSLRRQAYRRSLEILMSTNPEYMSLTSSEYGHSVRGARIRERSQSMQPNVQVSERPSADWMQEVSLMTEALVSEFELVSRG